MKNIERNRQLLQQLDIMRAKDQVSDVPTPPVQRKYVQTVAMKDKDLDFSVNYLSFRVVHTPRKVIGKEKHS